MKSIDKTRKKNPWLRFLVPILLGGAIGGVVGILADQEMTLPKFPFLSETFGHVSLLILISLLFVLIVLMSVQVKRNLAQLEDEVDDGRLDQLDLSIYRGFIHIEVSTSILTFLVIICFLLYLPHTTPDVLFFVEFCYLMGLFFLGQLLYRRTFQRVYGKPLPYFRNRKETIQLIFDTVDEAEAQAIYQTSYQTLSLLQSIVLPVCMIALVILYEVFSIDITAAIFTIIVIYLFVIVSQSRVVTYYFKK